MVSDWRGSFQFVAGGLVHFFAFMQEESGCSGVSIENNRTGLFVHFQLVLFDAMFDPCTGDSSARDAGVHVTDDFASDSAV
jgi:hypothetical protein